MSESDDRFPASTVRRRSSCSPTRRHCRDLFRWRDDGQPKEQLPEQRDGSEHWHGRRHRVRRDISTVTTTVDQATTSVTASDYPLTTTIFSSSANLTLVEVIELISTTATSLTPELVLPKTNDTLPP